MSQANIKTALIPVALRQHASFSAMDIKALQTRAEWLKKNKGSNPFRYPCQHCNGFWPVTYALENQRIPHAQNKGETSDAL